jgi:hypothetical protein
MPTKSGSDYLLGPTSTRHFSIPRIDHTTSDLGSAAFSDGPRTVPVMYAVGETQYTKLLLEDIYDADKQLLKHSVNTSGKAGAQILHLPLGDDSSPLGDNAVGR